jgi:N-acetylated-alpha-linked acidic dipeptidase
MPVAGVVVATLILLAVWIWPQPRRAPPFGFTRSAASSQQALESRFLALPDAARIRDAHRVLTRSPHPAGSPRDRELADWVAGVYAEAGMQDVRIVTHEVMLPQPVEVSVEMIAPRPWRAAMHERPVAGDSDTQIDPRAAGLPHHAYSASGEVTAPVVFAGRGAPEDYAWLAARGISVRGRIVLVRHSSPYSYRGFKALLAQQRGAAGILIYSDPADDGSSRGKSYPDGPWGPDSRIERGGIVYDFIAPGDPLTPGWPSLPGARRLTRADAQSLPAIISAPLNAEDARHVLDLLGGPAAPESWRGGLPIVYRTGPGPARLRLRVRMDDGIRPIWTVTGLLRGRDSPDEVVIVGNHRDAWTYGGVDPSGGSAALAELARTFGELVRTGWQPRRTILFASWDAEELALTSSTEWGEQHDRWLRDRAVAYLNVDGGASGPRFVGAGVPSLRRVLAEVAGVVRDPARGVPIAAVTREGTSRERGVPSAGRDEEIVDERLGGGSDYTVFLNHSGVPVADLGFDGPYGVYHTLFDTHQWVSRVGDPGFRYHAALVSLWGLATLRLAQADAIPLDPESSARAIEKYVADLERHAPGGWRPRLDEVNRAAGELTIAAKIFNERRMEALRREDGGALARMNRQVRRFERAFIDPQGLPGRPWYRHLIYAPRPTYEPVMLPGLTEALEAGNLERFAEQAARLTGALGGAARLLEER